MIHSTAKVYEEVNRKCPSRNMIIQLSTPYTDPEPSNYLPPKSGKASKADLSLKL